MKEVKIGLVGLGNLGKLHLFHLQNKVAGAKVIAICDMDEKRLAEAQEEFNVEHAYTDYHEMISNPDLDAVVLVTNVGAHKEQCIAAAEKGLNIFCEKPLAHTLEECYEIERAVEKNKGKVFQIGFMQRSDPSYVDMKKKVDAGVIGKPFMFKDVRHDPSTHLAFQLELVKTGGYTPWFCEMGIHGMDSMLWFMDSELESVYAIGGAYVEPGFAEYDDYDNAYALFKFKDGTCGYLEVGRTHVCAHHVHTEVVGTKGTMRLNNVPNRTRVEVFNADGLLTELEPTYLERWVPAYIAELEDFVLAINGEKEPPSTVYDGAKSLKMYMMTQKAYVENRKVTADEIDTE